MRDDPIVLEVRQIREKLIKQHGGLKKWVAYMNAHPINPNKQTVSFARSKPASVGTTRSVRAGGARRKAAA